MNAIQDIRDQKLRRAILRVLNEARGTSPRGGLSGETVLAVVESGSSDVRFDDEAHFAALVRDLAGLGLVTSDTVGLHRHERFRPSHLWLAITPDGVALLAEKIAASPLVWDERE